MSAPTLVHARAGGDDDAHAAEAALVRRLRDTVGERLAEANRVAERVTGAPLSALERAATVDRLVAETLDEHANASLAAAMPLLAPQVESRIGQAVRDRLLGLGGLEPLLNNPNIEDIKANGCDNVHVTYADGTRAQVPAFCDSDDDLIALIRMVAARSGNEERRFDRGSPMVSCMLPDGSRLFATMAVSPRPTLTIRRHRYTRVTLPELAAMGLFCQAQAEFLAAAVRARLNIMIAGAMGVGKTTLLRGLTSAIPAWERIITVEDIAELRLQDDPGHPDTIALQAREANLEGEGEVSLDALIRAAMRMTPDRVIVGEIRGGRELLAAMNAMSLGTDGSMTTIHAASSKGVFGKLVNFAAQSTERLDAPATHAMAADALDLVVHLGRDHDRARVLTSVREVVGFDGTQVVTNELYRPGPDRRAVPGAPPSEELLDRLIEAGLDPSWNHQHGGWTR